MTRQARGDCRMDPSIIIKPIVSWLEDLEKVAFERHQRHFSSLTNQIVTGVLSLFAIVASEGQVNRTARNFGKARPNLARMGPLSRQSLVTFYCRGQREIKTLVCFIEISSQPRRPRYKCFQVAESRSPLTQSTGSRSPKRKVPPGNVTYASFPVKSRYRNSPSKRRTRWKPLKKPVDTQTVSAVDRINEGGQTAVSKPRKSRRKKPKNATANPKAKAMATPCGEYRKEIQKCNTQAGTQATNQQPCSAPAIQNQTTSTAPMRPRSLYTAHSYHAQTDETNFQRYSEFSKYFEAPPSEQWGGLTNGTAFSNSTGLWRQPRNSKTIAPYYEETCVYSENWRDHDTDAAIVATPHGTISLRLHNRIRVDMTIERAVRVINFKNNIVLSLSGSGAAAALLHPNGRIYQYGSRVEILAHDAHGNNKYAKMWYKGVSFTSEQCALVYLVDTAGTRTTTDSFSDMSQDFSLSVFYSRSRHGPACQQEAAAALSGAQYWLTNEGVENWIINNVRVSQTPDGLVRIARNSNKYQLRTSPSNGTASLTTPFLHCTASLGQTSHLFVRRGERRMHYDGTSFIVRNAGHSAGFDDNNQLKVY